MDFLLILLIFFMFFCILRSYLRGSIISLMDVIALLISTILGTSLFKIVAHFLYTTSLYLKTRNAIYGMINFNSIMGANDKDLSATFSKDFALPSIISNFIDANNTPQVYNNNGIDNYDEYIVDVFTHIIIVTVAFVMIFLLVYLILNILRIIIMPHIKIVSFGVLDKVIACLLGAIKGCILTFVGLSFIPILFIEFNFQSVYNAICSSSIVMNLYNIDPIIQALLKGIYLN